MDPRERWHTLQSHLTSARLALESGNRTKALEEVDAALALDSNFLAAHSLRERVLNPAAAVKAVPAPAAAPQRPLVSTEGYAKFEQRAKRRRVDRRIDAARAALGKGKLNKAAAALDEVIELDPNLPELAALTAEFDELRRQQASVHRGPWVAAAAVFAMTVFGASWLHDTNALLSRATAGAVPLLNPPVPAVAVSASTPEATGTTGDLGSTVDRTPGTLDGAPRTLDRAPSTIDRAPTAIDRAPTTVDRAPTTIDRAPSTIATVPGTFASAPGTVVNAPSTIDRVIDLPPAVAAEAPAAPIAVPKVDEESLVKQVLQQYRRAYEGLDAQSAQAVYPAVNEGALARAFDGLSSQSLTFDACDVQLHGGSATATCRGSARYVAKIGSREPRTEPRVWNFTLRKNGTDWKIENARAER